MDRLIERKPYLPVYHRSPNKFIRYDVEPFYTPAGNGYERIAIFLDKKGKFRSKEYSERFLIKTKIQKDNYRNKRFRKNLGQNLERGKLRQEFLLQDVVSYLK